SGALRLAEPFPRESPDRYWDIPERHKVGMIRNPKHRPTTVRYRGGRLRRRPQAQCRIPVWEVTMEIPSTVSTGAAAPPRRRPYFLLGVGVFLLGLFLYAFQIHQKHLV